MVKIKKRQTLRDQLRGMPIGDTAEIVQRKSGYSPQRIREACHKLKKEGFLYECTERGLVDAIRVTRLQ
jgi:uncharacterized Fe-S cluster-containing protein